MIRTLLFSLIVAVTSNLYAQVNTPVCAPAFDGALMLNLVNPLKSKLKEPVAVQWNIDEDHLIVNFDVNSPVLHQKKVFGPKDYPFNYDVVEIFLAVGDPKEKAFSYYEFNLTPNKQTFIAKFDVASDGKKKYQDGLDVGLQVATNVTAKSWSGSFSIPLKNLGWNGDVKFIRGNFFSILDKKPNRSFWSAFLPKQTKADFHKPEYFKALFECK